MVKDREFSYAVHTGAMLYTECDKQCGCEACSKQREERLRKR